MRSRRFARVFLTTVGSIAELERSPIMERIRAGMRRARNSGLAVPHSMSGRQLCVTAFPA